jgi:large subunit ribosomal protein L24
MRTLCVRLYLNQEWNVAKIKKGDTVGVITGEDVGQRGVVQRTSPKSGRVVVAGVNMITKHQRPVQTRRGQVRAGRIEYEAPIHTSNVMLVCPQCGEPTRVGFVINESGVKTRVCKKCRAEIA